MALSGLAKIGHSMDLDDVIDRESFIAHEFFVAYQRGFSQNLSGDFETVVFSLVETLPRRGCVAEFQNVAFRFSGAIC